MPLGRGPVERLVGAAEASLGLWCGGGSSQMRAVLVEAANVDHLI